jgi:monoamine oxidase
MTRREFIWSVVRAGGSAAAALSALDLREPSPPSSLPDRRGDGGGQHILVLGGGLAGLSAAYELRKLGYSCTILEARTRPGGRCWSVRGGDTTSEIDGPTQTAAFDSGHYLNAGAARIPHHHSLTMDYCEELGVELEMFANDNEAAYYYVEGEGTLADEPVRARTIETDLYGYTSELLAKCVHEDKLDTPLSGKDEERLLSYLRERGALSDDFSYEGSSRRGYESPPSPASDAELADPFTLESIIKSGFGDQYSYAYGFHQQPTMFEPVGGMDRIPHAFAEELKRELEYGAKIDGVFKKPNGGVRVSYVDARNCPQQVEGDYCVCTIPLPVLSSTENNMSAEMTEAIDAVDFARTGKIGLQFSRRFWEEDDHIYGGVSRTSMDITQIWYPNYDFFADKGVLVGYYNFGDTAEKVGGLGAADREELALKQGSKIHPQYREEFENSFSIAWHKTQYQEGGWANYDEETRGKYYSRLTEPDGPIYLAGDQISNHPGWMNAAFKSAHYAVRRIHDRAAASPPTSSSGG